MTQGYERLPDEQKREETRSERSPRASRRRARGAASSASAELPWTLGGLGILVIGAPQLLGGVFAWGSVSIAACAVATLSLLLWESRSCAAEAFGVEPFLGVLTVVLCLTMLQVVPLPSALAELVAADAVAHARSTAQGLGAPEPAWIALSLDPGNTVERIFFVVAVMASFCVARALAAVVSGTLVLMIAAASTICIAVSHLCHVVIGATRVYGLYKPYVAASTGPLLNPNHLAGFMALGLPLCIGLAVRSEAAARAAWALGALLVATTGLLSGSRAGVAALVGGAVLFVALHLTRDRRVDAQGSSRSRFRRIVEVAAPTVVLSGLSYALARFASPDFLDTDYHDLTKLELYTQELALLQNAGVRALVGFGRGAFGAAFSTAYGGPGRALYAESLPLQYAIDFGLPAAVILGTITMFRLGMRFWHWRSSAHLGGVVGVAAIAAQNLFDFSLELTGIATPCAVVLGASLPRANASGLSFRLFDVRVTSRALLMLSVALFALGAYPAVQGDLIRAEQRLKDDLLNDRRDAFWALFRSVAPRHPAEASLASLAGAQAVREGAPSAPFWLNRAMLLAPGWTAPHLWAAQWLAYTGRWDQARGELRLAAESAPEESGTMLCGWLAKQPSAELVLASAPDSGRQRIRMLDSGARCLSAAPGEALSVDEAILTEDPTHEGALVRNIRRALSSRRWDAALDAARSLQRSAPRLSIAYVLQAEALEGLGEPHRAAGVLANAPTLIDDRRAILTALAFAQSAARDEIGMRDTVERLRLESGGNAAKLADALVILGRCEAALGNTARAMRALREAHGIGAGDGSLVAAAHLATQLGQLDFALSVWNQLCDERSAARAYCVQRDDLLKRTRNP